jgi:hypothetical protein
MRRFEEGERVRGGGEEDYRKSVESVNACMSKRRTTCCTAQALSLKTK